MLCVKAATIVLPSVGKAISNFHTKKNSAPWSLNLSHPVTARVSRHGESQHNMKIMYVPEESVGARGAPLGGLTNVQNLLSVACFAPVGVSEPGPVKAWCAPSRPLMDARSINRRTSMTCKIMRPPSPLPPFTPFPLPLPSHFPGARPWRLQCKGDTWRRRGRWSRPGRALR